MFRGGKIQVAAEVAAEAELREAGNVRMLEILQQAEQESDEQMPTPRMFRPMGRVMMWSVVLRGGSCITRSSGGREASASAAKVSMMRFTQSI